MSATDHPRRTPASAFSNAWTMFHVREVPIRLDISWVLICGLVLYIFATSFVRLLSPYGLPAIITAAAAAALLFFASILGHELGHAVTSLDRGVPVSGVTLFLLGGVTESTREPRSARDELVIVGSGPFISLVLAAAFALLHNLSPGANPVGAVTGYLAWTNLALAVFNVLPGYPLDGGRLLRSVLWAGTGSRHQATRWAARVGQVFAGSIIVGGLYGLVDGPVPGAGAARFVVLSLSGNWLWSLLIGLFLLRGAVDAHRRARAHEAVAGRTAGQVMGAVPPTLPTDLPLDRAVLDIQRRPSLLWPVGTPLAGGVRLKDLDRVPEKRWEGTTVGEVATAADEVTVDVHTPLDQALERLAEAPGQVLIVTSSGQPVGLLTSSIVGGLPR